MLDRIQQLQENGYHYLEFEVYTSNELSEDSEYYYDVNKHDGEASFVDKVAAFFTGEDPEERVFSKYEWDEASKEQAKRAIDNGLYVLVVDREGYYENEENFRYLDNPENRENDYINNPEYNRDDYVGNSEYFENDDLPPRDDMENLYDDETFQNKEYNGNLDSNLGRPYDENLDRHFDEVHLTEE
ncbi:general stress protein [Helcococcus kunzii]|uniref:general stress protein n=1 Tax=Helcococcus kunzii TaxID=40091 RepID=UPI001C93C8AD|nr:general stress protein [Helcococcus kunzii]QZO76187.1 general stress protein [Helcococcus kunzii]